MVLTPAIAAALLRDIHVLDGGMASELEYLGANIEGPLWSAHVLEEAPEKIVTRPLRSSFTCTPDCGMSLG